MVVDTVLKLSSTHSKIILNPQKTSLFHSTILPISAVVLYLEVLVTGTFSQRTFSK